MDAWLKDVLYPADRLYCSSPAVSPCGETHAQLRHGSGKSTFIQNHDWGCHGNQGTPTVRTIRAMSGDTVTLPASYDVSMPVIAVTWNRLEGPESESTRVGVYMYSPRANGSLSMSLVPPTVTVGLQIPLKVPVNTSVTLNCTVSKKKAEVKKVMWLKDGRSVPSHIKRRELEDTSHYRQNSDATMTKNPTKNAKIRGSAQAQYVLPTCLPEARVCMITCAKKTVGGRYSLAGTFEPLLESRVCGITCAKKTSLEMWRVARQDMGNYTCVAQHVGGQVSDSLILDVTFPGIIINISNPVVVTSGMTAVLRCTADGNPLPDIRWHREGERHGPGFRVDYPEPYLSIVLDKARQELGVTSPEEEMTSRVILPDVHVSDSGWYWCVASNGVGQPGRQRAFLSVLGGELSMPSKYAPSRAPSSDPEILPSDPELIHQIPAICLARCHRPLWRAVEIRLFRFAAVKGNFEGHVPPRGRWKGHPAPAASPWQPSQTRTSSYRLTQMSIILPPPGGLKEDKLLLGRKELVVDSLTWLDISIIAGVATGGASLVLTLLIAGIICARKRRDKPSYNTCQVVRITQPAEFMCRVNGWTGVCQAGAGDKNAKRCRAQVISSYYPPGDGGLHLEVGEVVEILHTGRDGWWYGYRRGRVGIFPAWCVQVIDEPESEPVKGLRPHTQVFAPTPRYSPPHPGLRPHTQVFAPTPSGRSSAPSEGPAAHLTPSLRYGLSLVINCWHREGTPDAIDNDIEVRSTNGSSDENSRHASGQSSPARENGGNEETTTEFPDVEKPPKDDKSKWPSEESVK
ncbi:hypothetical protein Bbelb_120900 [Branchiostoma belcheri]|nr:hypothetical protein Bbelb_120900 [Branchiostoma belcheri]